MSGSMFSSSEQVAACSDCSRLGNALCLLSPVQSAQAVLERGHKSSAIDFAVKTFDCLLEQPSGEIANKLQGLKLEIKLQLCRLTKGFICSEVPKSIVWSLNSF